MLIAETEIMTNSLLEANEAARLTVGYAAAVDSSIVKATEVHNSSADEYWEKRSNQEKNTRRPHLRYIVLLAGWLSAWCCCSKSIFVLLMQIDM